MARILIALGGNALGNTPEKQKENVAVAARVIVELIEQGNELVVSHGNGPQVGMIELAFGTAAGINENICTMPLPECTAMSQGYIGYHLQNGLKREMLLRNIDRDVVALTTQVVVDENDPSFQNPTKPIGLFYSKEKMDAILAEKPELHFAEDAGRGYRQVVPSPVPLSVVEVSAARRLLEQGYIAIIGGGGGIPVIRKPDGSTEGIAAVIDKDLSSAVLAEQLDCEYLFILTAVDYVCIDYNKPTRKELKSLTVEEAERYCREGQFAAGSMLPKIRAAIHFVQSGTGRNVIIGALEKASLALSGQSGTLITR